jgi:hypothetical protein
LNEITKDSQPTTIYILKQLGFNSKSSFKAFKSGIVSVNEIIRDAELFVNNLPDGSIHFKNLNVIPGTQAQFSFKTGQKACLLGTINAICEKILAAEPASTSSPSTSTQPPAKRQRRTCDEPDPEFDILKLQEYVNNHLSPVIASLGYTINHFQVMASETEEFPYSVVIECPLCFKCFKTKISVDIKNGQKYLNYRRTTFINHFKQCVQNEDETEDEHEDSGD